MGRRAKAPYVQMNLGDSFLNLSSRGQKAIRQSRLGHFGDQVFDKIPYEDFAVRFLTRSPMRISLSSTVIKAEALRTSSILLLPT